MTIEERRKYLATRLRQARQKAQTQRKQNRKSTGALQNVIPKKHFRMTQAFAAKQLGVSQSYLSKLEKGLREPSFLLVEKMAAYYGVKKLTWFQTYSLDDRKERHHLNDL